MRARSVLGLLGTVAFGLTASGLGGACFTQPSDDFDAFRSTIANLPPAPQVEASVFEAAPPPAQAVSGLYYGACLTEFAFGQTTKVFNLYTQTSFTPAANGQSATLQLSVRVLKIVNSAAPPTATASGEVGDEIKGTPAAVPVDASGHFSFDFGTVTFPGSANPISGGDVVILGTKLVGHFDSSTFCGSLQGQVTEPAAAARTLDPKKNICQFFPTKDGDPTQPFSLSSCPF
jgi:hypothetical protein